MTSIRNLLISGFAVAPISTPAPVNAQVPYWDKVGITMRYDGIIETTMTAGDPAVQYGAPFLAGHALVFNAMNFRSQASGGAVDQTDGKLDFTIRPKGGGDFINKIRLQEFGDTSLTGIGTGVTRSTAAAPNYPTVTMLDTGAPVFPYMFALNMSMSKGGVYTVAGGPFTGKLWNGGIEISLTTLLGGLHATEVVFSMDNILTTTSEINSSALIVKKQAGLRVEALPIPEPGVFSLLLLGGLLFLRRR